MKPRSCVAGWRTGYVTFPRGANTAARPIHAGRRLVVRTGRGRWQRPRADPDRVRGGSQLDQPAVLRQHGVDNRVFGSGNKALHNVVGGLGVFEGKGGDLRTGLPWQWVHDGERLAHEPLRLNGVVEAPVTAINDVLRPPPPKSARWWTTAGSTCSQWTTRARSPTATPASWAWALFTAPERGLRKRWRAWC